MKAKVVRTGIRHVRRPPRRFGGDFDRRGRHPEALDSGVEGSDVDDSGSV